MARRLARTGFSLNGSDFSVPPDIILRLDQPVPKEMKPGDILLADL